jgi:hypothetical protein
VLDDVASTFRQSLPPPQAQPAPSSRRSSTPRAPRESSPACTRSPGTPPARAPGEQRDPRRVNVNIIGRQRHKASMSLGVKLAKPWFNTERLTWRALKYANKPYIWHVLRQCGEQRVVLPPQPVLRRTCVRQQRRARQQPLQCFPRPRHRRASRGRGVHSSTLQVHELILPLKPCNDPVYATMNAQGEPYMWACVSPCPAGGPLAPPGSDANRGAHGEAAPRARSATSQSAAMASSPSAANMR